MQALSVYTLRDRCQGKPLVIYGAGPGFDLLPTPPEDCHVFALNHTITELWRHPLAFWVSNDHDRTWANRRIRKGVLPRIAGYSPWRTITQKKFIEGSLGSFVWVDHKGRSQPPMTWRLPAPEGSTIFYYNAGRGNEGLGDYLEAGETVLDLALEVATLWGFGPIVLVGCDLTLDRQGEYYAPRFRWKDTPPKMAHGKLAEARRLVAQKRVRWPSDVFLVSDLWKDAPFVRIRPGQALDLVKGAPWSRT